MIRRGSIADLNDICMIENKSFDDHYPRFLLAELLRMCPAFFVAVDVESRVIGYCVASVRGDEAHLISIAVMQTRRRSGIARVLVGYLTKFLSSRNVKTLFLEVRVKNSGAIRLYSDLGFRPIRVIARYYSDGASALKMRIALTSVDSAAGFR